MFFDIGISFLSFLYKGYNNIKNKVVTSKIIEIRRFLIYIYIMPENRKIKIKDETDKTLYEVKLDAPTENKKMNPVLKACLLILAIPAGFAIGYLLFKYL